MKQNERIPRTKSEDPRYAIVGNGRMARHLGRYFQLLNIPFLAQERSRACDDEADYSFFLSEVVKDCQVVLVLISDSAIDGFINSHSFLTDKILVHFSGSLVSGRALGMHPLFTFGPKLYDLKTYQSIPFIVEQGRYSFNDIFPGLNNSHYTIGPEDKPLYHALCVISGNFTTLLWQSFFKELEERFNIPREVCYPYLSKIVENVIEDPIKALTGPIARKDYKTIKDNLDSLNNIPYQHIYRSFLQVFLPEILETDYK